MKNRPSGIKHQIKCVLGSGLTSIALASSVQAATPNAIIILADDIGYGDLGCYGATKIKTPNIDRLAKEGMLFTAAQAPSGVCTPTRYGVLTGRYCWRSHLQQAGLPATDPLMIPPTRMTLGSLFKGLGHTTAAIGKWHLGYGSEKPVDWNKPLTPGPHEIGFDYHFGVPSNHNDKLRVFVRNDAIVGRKPGEKFAVLNDGVDLPEGVEREKCRKEDQVDTTCAAEVVRFIEASKDRPFFLYYTPMAGHTFTTPAAKFRGGSECGLFGDHVQELDSHIGDILQTLDRLHLADKTIVILASDNGGALNDYTETKRNLNLADDSGNVREKQASAKEDAQKMGHLTNGILRGGKSSALEGGTRIPMVVRWPGLVKPGSRSDQTVCLIDWLATFAEFTGTQIPSDAGEDSFSFLPVLRGEEKPSRDCLVTHSGNGRFAIRQGKWKLLLQQGKGSEDEEVFPCQLYDLDADIGETRNLADQHPDIVRHLTAKLEQIVADGRSTPGPKLKNDVAVEIFKKGLRE